MGGRSIIEAVFSHCLDYLHPGWQQELSKRQEGEQDCCPCFCAGKGARRGLPVPCCDASQH